MNYAAGAQCQQNSRDESATHELSAKSACQLPIPALSTPSAPSVWAAYKVTSGQMKGWAGGGGGGSKGGGGTHPVWKKCTNYSSTLEEEDNKNVGVGWGGGFCTGQYFLMQPTS